MKYAHAIAFLAPNKVMTLCGKLYNRKALVSEQTGVAAQKCPACIEAINEKNWLTLEVGV